MYILKYIIYMYLCSTLYYELLRLVSSIKTLSRKTGIHVVALLKTLQPMERVMELNRGPVVGIGMEISRGFPSTPLVFTHLLGRVG